MRYGTFTYMCLLLGCFLTSSVQAQFVYPYRSSFFDITFANNDFSDANAYYQVKEDAYSTNGPDSVYYEINPKYDHTDFVWGGYGGTNVYILSQSSDFVPGYLTSDGTYGGYIFSYNTPPETEFNNLGTFGNTWLVRKDFGGLIGLEFQGGGSRLLDINGYFTLDLLINGDWSHMGTEPFQTEFIGLDSNWQIDKSFVFDGTNTEFQAHINTYGFHDPNLDFILHGPVAVTPEPSIYLLLASLGMTSAGFLAQRNKTRKTAIRV